MFKMCVCCLLLLAGCTPGAAPGSQWEGTYIGYIHHNQQDTTPVTLVFEGKYYAAAPYGRQSEAESTGVFEDDRSELKFQNTTAATLPRLKVVVLTNTGSGLMGRCACGSKSVQKQMK